MQKEYISWSELYCYQKDKNEYYMQYILNYKPEPTDEMVLGSLIHDSLSGKITDLNKELDTKHFTSDYKRICADLLEATPRYEGREHAMYLKGNKENGLLCDVLTIYDGWDHDKNLIAEYKTTKNGWRTQGDVDNHHQLTLYALTYYYISGRIPSIILHRLDTGNGKVKTFTTTRTINDFENLTAAINNMYTDLVDLGWWKRRTLRSNKLVVEAMNNTKVYEQARNRLLRTSERE